MNIAEVKAEILKQGLAEEIRRRLTRIAGILKTDCQLHDFKSYDKWMPVIHVELAEVDTIYQEFKKAGKENLKTKE